MTSPIHFRDPVDGTTKSQLAGCRMIAILCALSQAPWPTAKYCVDRAAPVPKSMSSMQASRSATSAARRWSDACRPAWKFSIQHQS